MAVIVRGLGIGIAATAAYVLMTVFDDGAGGANIGAGLVVFAVLIVAGFVWALLDGAGVGGAARAGRGSLLVRWVVASVVAVAVVEAAQVLLNGADRAPDIDASTLLFLVLLVLLPSAVGILIGYAVRNRSAVGSGPGEAEPGGAGPGGTSQTRSS